MAGDLLQDGTNHPALTLANSARLLGAAVERLRRKRGISRQTLYGTEFSLHYMRALLAGEVIPSPFTLELLASRLDVQPEELLQLAQHLGEHKPRRRGSEAVGEGSSTVPTVGVSTSEEATVALPSLDMATQEEDLIYALNRIRHLIRHGTVSEASTALDMLQAQAHGTVREPGQIASTTGLDYSDYSQRSLYFPYLSYTWYPGGYWELISGPLKYQFPFLRARIRVALNDQEGAIKYLEDALKLAGEDHAAKAQVHYLLGSVFYARQQQVEALKEHLLAVDYVHRYPRRNFSFTLSVYQSLANDYVALGYNEEAAATYRRSLHLMEDLPPDDRKGRLYWGLAEACRKLNKPVQAMTYGLQASEIYRSTGSKGEATAVLLNLSEMLIENGRHDKAAELLSETSSLLGELQHPGLASYLHLYSARLARQTGNLEAAAAEAGESVRLAQELEHLLEPVSNSLPGDGPPQPNQVSAPAGEQGEQGENRAPWLNHPWVSPERTLIEAMLEAAIIEECRSQREDADRLFQKVLSVSKLKGVEDLRKLVAHNYAAVFRARGDHESASRYMLESMKP